jgi:hypothetical protein
MRDHAQDESRCRHAGRGSARVELVHFEIRRIDVDTAPVTASELPQAPTASLAAEPLGERSVLGFTYSGLGERLERAIVEVASPIAGAGDVQNLSAEHGVGPSPISAQP